MAEKKQAIFFNDDSWRFPVLYPEELRARIRALADFPDEIYSSKDLDDPALAGLFARTRVIFSSWGMPALTEAQIAAHFPNLEAVYYAAGTVQYFARPFLKRGVRVFSAWAANGVPVVEFTVAQIVLAGKGYFQSLRRYRERDRKAAFAYTMSLPCNYNIRVGILGAGVIGREVMARLKAYQYEVLAYDPYVSDEVLSSLGAKRASLEEIFSTCQIISNHVANLPATVGMIDGKLLHSMLPNAALINTGRGAQVVESELIAALKACPDRTALLDVTWPEPPQEGSEFYTLPNVFLTPHIAGSQNNEWARMALYMVEEFERTEDHLPVRYEVTEKMLETMA